MKSRLILFLFFIGLTACFNESQTEQSSSASDIYPDQESWNAEIKITRNGKLSGLVKAGHIKSFSSQKRTELSENITVDFFKQDGQHSSVLTARGGLVFDDRDDMIAFGNVIVVSDSGVALYTDTLHWFNKEQKISSKVPVKITTQNDTLFGDNLVSDPHLRNYELTNSHGSSAKSVKVTQ